MEETSHACSDSAPRVVGRFHVDLLAHGSRAGPCGSGQSQGQHGRQKRSAAEFKPGHRHGDGDLRYEQQKVVLEGQLFRTAAHFHSGESGKNGPIVVPITPATSPFEGSATLTDPQADELLAGKWYVNVHTEANKGGEIRGQVTK
jgi:hypothetical protein